ncbi:MAG: AAA family ATPase [Motiliproteus sp.]
MTDLRLSFLGNFQVIRDNEVVPLPPSKKTRALLAYLALNSRAFRREQLCELLWDIPDDPRGSLRWSLSKIRALVDSKDQPRVIADRSQVRLDSSDTLIDVTELHALACSPLDPVPVETLEAAIDRYSGHFLEGLELTNFYQYYAWCVAEREQVGQDLAAILQNLIHRFVATPARALPHARRLVDNSPYEEPARAGLIQLLLSNGRPKEAEQQYRLGKRLLAEIGVEPSSLLYQAWRGAPGEARTVGTSSTVTIPTDVINQPDIAIPTNAASHTEAFSQTRAHSHSPATVQPAASRSTLLGREQETEQLAEAFARVVQQNSAGFVLVRGVAGIGKSRLLQTIAELARDNNALLLQASAFEQELLRPFALWIDALRQYSATTQQEIFDASGVDNRDRLIACLSDKLAVEAGKRPLVLLFDDFQWCDESSAAALHYVARLCAGLPIFGVLAARDEDIEDNRAALQTLRGLRHDKLLQDIHLGPLPPAALNQLIRDCAPDADAEPLSRASMGNPLLAIELARALCAGTGGGSIDELISERMSQFNPDATEVLRWAAVLSPRINTVSLEPVTGLTPEGIDEALVMAQAHSLLMYTDLGFRFCHDLIARSIYNAISPTRLRVMHRRVAELLEQKTAVDLGYAADLAHHASQSGDAGLAARAMVSAGRLCLRFFANTDAQSLARKGQQLATRLPDRERVCLSLDLHDILLCAAPIEDWQSAADTYIALAETALDHDCLAHARLGYQMASYLRWSHGQWASAREESMQAERITRGGTDKEHIIGLAEAARCLALLEKDLGHANALLLEAQALASRKQINVEAILAAQGMLHYHRNELGAAEEQFKEARTLCKTHGNRFNEFQANEYLAMIAFERQQYPQALARSQEMIDIGQKLREGSEAPFAHAFSHLCRYAIDGDCQPLDSALEQLRIADAKHRLAYILTRTALLDLQQGQPQAARKHASEALDYAQALERATEMMLANLALALASKATGDDIEHRRAVAAIASLDAASVASWARNRARILLAPKPPG